MHFTKFISNEEDYQDVVSLMDLCDGLCGLARRISKSFM